MCFGCFMLQVWENFPESTDVINQSISKWLTASRAETEITGGEKETAHFMVQAITA